MASGTAKKPVYLRGIPSEVVREAKAQAARRGITLAGFVADTLARAMTEQAGASSVGAPASSVDELADEMRWYEKNRARLLREHAGEYVAIAERSVIDHDADFEALAQRVFASDGAGHQREVFMPLVEAKPTTLRVRSPRLARRG